MLDVAATARSGGIVSLFYRLRHRSESIFSAQELKPVAFVSQQTDNSQVHESRDQLLRRTD